MPSPAILSEYDSSLREVIDLARGARPRDRGRFGTGTPVRPLTESQDGRIYHLVGHCADLCWSMAQSLREWIWSPLWLQVSCKAIYYPALNCNQNLWATSRDNGNSIMSLCTRDLHDGHIAERIGAVDQTGKVKGITTTFAYKVKEIYPQPPRNEKEMASLFLPVDKK